MSEGNRASENEATGKRFSKIKLDPLKKPHGIEWEFPKHGDMRDQVLYGDEPKDKK